MGWSPRASSALRILLVDTDAVARDTLRVALETRIARPLMIVEAADREAAGALIAGRGFDVIAADLGTSGGPDGFADLCGRCGATAYALGPRSAVRDAVAAVQSGAADFIEKPIDGAAFARRIERQFVQADSDTSAGFEGMAGQSAPMAALYGQIMRVAPSSAPVFIFGESGTGKSLAARAVHAQSRRRSGAFVAVDCAGFDDAALAEELSRPGGAIDRAAGGTLLLDEIGRLGETTQVLLMRLLENGETGALDARRKADVRLVATTNRPQAELTGRPGLRADLYFRLAVLTIDVPPLRDRGEDAVLVCETMLRRAAREIGARMPRLSPAAARRLATHAWPGNVRELKNLAERLVLRCEGETVDVGLVAALLGPTLPVRAGEGEAIRIRPLWMEEERIIEEAIAAFGGNISRAAAALEISPSTIYRKRRPRPEDDRLTA